MRVCPSSRASLGGRACGMALVMAVWGGIACNEISGASGFEGGEAVDAGKDSVDAAVPPEDGGKPRVDAGEDAGTDGGPGVKHVFVTDETFTADLGGRVGADAKCMAAAAAAGLRGTYIAWLSIIGGKAIDRITHQGAYHRLDDAEVVASRIELTSGSLTNAISVTEKNAVLTENRGVWTGTRPNGSADATCLDWTTESSSERGTMASAQATDNGWTKGAGPPLSGSEFWTCDSAVSLYCFEQ